MITINIDKGLVDCLSNAIREYTSRRSYSKPARSVTPGMRREIFMRDNFTCVDCGRSPRTGDGVILHTDHIIPVSKGGRCDMENLQTLCSKCNLGKSDKFNFIPKVPLF